MFSDFKDIKNLIAKCLNTDAVTISKAESITSGSGCEVLDCSFTVSGRPSQGILKIYKEGYDDYSEIGVMRTDLSIKKMHFMLDVKNVLSPDQIAKIEALKKEMRIRRFKRRDRSEPGQRNRSAFR